MSNLTMPKARCEQVSLDDTAYYHCVSRCVRHAFLCGVDQTTGKSFEHRRGWVEQRLLALAEVFAIDICAYAVMSNHTHVVLHINRDQALSWDTRQVLERWHKLHKGTLLTSRFLDEESLDEASLRAVMETAEVYRNRLHDVSWFMRDLNETIARQANKEDGCTGRFWEGRFKSQALLDDAALLACMAYVDLNPIRANIAKTPETSDFTSVKKRTDKLKHSRGKPDSPVQPECLYPFVGDESEHTPEGLNFTLKDYLLLVDMSGRVIREDKPGAILPDCPPILSRLGIDEALWTVLVTSLEENFSGPIGTEGALRSFQHNHGLQRMQGISAAKRCFRCA
ncbi:transposase [Vibrio sp. WXL103]|uniref:transposase n=1 Tax=Vibrio sp. WXL103 TaxID=3450710 RepID=UPI003EC566F0